MFILILKILWLLILFPAAWAGLSFAPWVPSRKKDLPRIFKLANLQPGEIFYDLGCGDGRTIFYAANNFPVESIGLEISPPMYAICKIRQIFHKGQPVKIKLKSLYRERLNKADVVFFFGLPRTLQAKMVKKLKTEMKPGSRVISYCFDVEGMTPTQIDKPEGNHSPIYLYQM